MSLYLLMEQREVQERTTFIFLLCDLGRVLSHPFSATVLGLKGFAGDLSGHLELLRVY